MVDVTQLYLALEPLASFALIIVATWLVARFASLVFARVVRGSVPMSVETQARRLAWILIWLVGSILAIEQLPIRSDILLLVVGLLGVASILALREPLENVGAKYSSDVYSTPFKIGDSIRVRDYSGKVIQMNSMTTVLLTEGDRLVSIPNSLFMKEIVINTTPQAWKEVTIPLTVGSQIDLAAFESAALKSISKLRLHLDRRFPPVLTTRSRTPQSTELTLTVMIMRPEERDAIVTEINNRVFKVIETMGSSNR